MPTSKSKSLLPLIAGAEPTGSTTHTTATTALAKVQTLVAQAAAVKRQEATPKLTPEEESELAELRIQIDERNELFEGAVKSALMCRFQLGESLFRASEILKKIKGFDRWIEASKLGRSTINKAIRLYVEFRAAPKKLEQHKTILSAEISVGITKPTRKALPAPSGSSAPSSGASSSGSVPVDATFSTIPNPSRDIVEIHGRLVEISKLKDLPTDATTLYTVRACIPLLQQTEANIVALQKFEGEGEEMPYTKELARTTVAGRDRRMPSKRAA